MHLVETTCCKDDLKRSLKNLKPSAGVAHPGLGGNKIILKSNEDEVSCRRRGRAAGNKYFMMVFGGDCVVGRCHTKRDKSQSPRDKMYRLPEWKLKLILICVPW